MNADAKIADNFVFADVRCLVVVMLLYLVKILFRRLRYELKRRRVKSSRFSVILRYVSFVQQTADARPNLRRIASSKKVEVIQLMI